MEMVYDRKKENAYPGKGRKRGKCALRKPQKEVQFELSRGRGD